jgi:predicted branched-subunit amino acid permease
MRIPVGAPEWRAAFRRGFLAGVPFIVSNGVAGAVMGVAYRGVGLGVVSAVSFSVVVYSATAQAVTLGLWAAPPPLLAMVVACMATNARYLVMGAHLRHLFADVPRRVMLPILLLLADASWLMTAAEAERGRHHAGYLLGASVPMAFIVALLPTQWRGRPSVLPWTCSAVVAVGVATTLGHSWAMLIGGGVGTLLSVLRGDDA